MLNQLHILNLNMQRARRDRNLYRDNIPGIDCTGILGRWARVWDASLSPASPVEKKCIGESLKMSSV